MPPAARRQVVIVHGWSDTSDSFRPLVRFLERHGWQAVPLWLGDYISMDDDVRIEDVAKRLEAAVRRKMALSANPLRAPFDMIVHSTGGLVARRWITAHYAADPTTCPVKRLVMLAPANFGSPLAAKGKSFLGRVVKGYDNWFHTGKEMLDSLEAGSAFQWNLATRDLLVAPGDPDATAFYGPDLLWPFVITGTHPYTSLLKSIVSENGSDGTVRASGTGLNARGATLDFTVDGGGGDPEFRPWALRRVGPLPMAVLPARTHASIIDPAGGDVLTAPDYRDPLGDLLLRALSCGSGTEYRAIADEWLAVTDATADLADADPAARERLLPKDDPDSSADWFHRYSQVMVHVVDDHGAPVPDYFLEFLGPDDSGSEAPGTFLHGRVIENVHAWSRDRSYRCLYLDWTDLVEGFYSRIGDPDRRMVRMSISAAPAGPNVSYFRDSRYGARGLATIHSPERGIDRWLKPHCTQLLEIVIPRTPRNEVFRLRRSR